MGGEPLFLRAVRALLAVQEVTRVVLVVPPGWEERAKGAIARADPLPLEPTIVTGGTERGDSVRAGLAAAGAAPLIAIHDAARPFVTAEVIRAVIGAARVHGAAVPCIPATDTIKQVHAEGWIEATPPRAHLWLAQTPQVFQADIIRAAHAGVAADAATDDAMLVERLGRRVYVVPGDVQNRKITTPEDLRWAEWILARPAVPR